MWRPEPFRFNVCRFCGGTEFFISKTGYDVICDTCSRCQDNGCPLVSDPVFCKTTQSYESFQAPTSFDYFPRYRAIFHWRERVAQMCCLVPEIPREDMDSICNEADNGKWPPRGCIDRPRIVMILRKLGMVKYIERWKMILCHVNPTYKPYKPTQQLLARMEAQYIRIEREFFETKNDNMPKSNLRKGNAIIRKSRHNNMPFNYIFCKISESMGIRIFHEELPQLKSCQKLHALDDAMEEIALKLDMPFRRTAIIKRPKLRKKNKWMVTQW